MTILVMWRIWLTVCPLFGCLHWSYGWHHMFLITCWLNAAMLCSLRLWLYRRGWQFGLRFWWGQVWKSCRGCTLAIRQWSIRWREEWGGQWRIAGAGTVRQTSQCPVAASQTCLTDILAYEYIACRLYQCNVNVQLAHILYHCTSWGSRTDHTLNFFRVQIVLNHRLLNCTVLSNII